MIQNAFTSIRPRGKDIKPSKAPVVGNRSRAPVEGNVHLTLAVSQPPHFGSLGARPSPERDDVASAAASAHRAAQFERTATTSRNGGRAVVKV